MIMSWEEILKEIDWKDRFHEIMQTECNVRQCDAITCDNNAYEGFEQFESMKRCMLDEVDVDSNGKCKSFEVTSNTRSPGQQSLIDRTRRMSNQTPAPLGGESTYEEV